MRLNIPFRLGHKYLPVGGISDNACNIRFMTTVTKDFLM